jgi:hypothetical protein
MSRNNRRACWTAFYCLAGRFPQIGEQGYKFQFAIYRFESLHQELPQPQHLLMIPNACLGGLLLDMPWDV